MADEKNLVEIENASEAGKKISATASGTNTYTASLDPALTVYSNTDVVTIRFTNANTGASTLNLNGLGAKSIVKNGSTAVASGDITAGQILSLAYDGTNFQIIGTISTGGGTVATSAELNTGTNNTKFASPLALENSKYVNQNGNKISATASGTNTYTATITPTITAYSNTQRFFIRFTNANTGSSTLNLNGLGAKSLRKKGSMNLILGDIKAGQIVLVAYDGTNFQIIGGGAGTETITVNITSGLTTGSATAGFLASTNKMIEYEILGGGAGTSKIVYYSSIIPLNYSSGGVISINTWTNDNVGLTTWTLTAYINGVVDSTINAVSIKPTADSVYQLKSNTFGSALATGDVIMLQLDFTGGNGDDVRLNKLYIQYN